MQNITVHALSIMINIFMHRYILYWYSLNQQTWYSLVRDSLCVTDSKWKLHVGYHVVHTKSYKVSTDIKQSGHYAESTHET